VTSTVSRSVTPGAWYGVLGDVVVVLLPPSAKARVAALWEAVDEGAGFDEVLDALISGGLRELPGFVLVSSDAGDVKVVIRGAGEAELTTAEGPVSVSGAADTTWVERHVSGVTAMRLHVADGEGTPYTVGSGLVRVAVVEQPAAVADAPAVVVPPVVEPQPVAGERVPTHLGDPTEPAAPAAESAAPEPVVPEPAPAAPEPAAPESAAPEPAAPAAWTPQPPPVYVPPVPMTAPISAPAVPGPAPEEAEAADTGDTQSQEFAPGQIAPPTGAPQASPSRAVARLIFSSGDVVDVDRAILVGRAPEARRFGGDEQARVVTVPSPQQEISSTHLEIRPGAGADHGSAVVTDLGSTNGTVVVQPGLAAEDLQPGIAVQLIPGAVVDLGEGVTIQVTTV
jgi:FHA domain